MKLTRGLEDLVASLDTLVQRAAEPENATLTNSARVVLWTGPLLRLFSVILLQWTVYIAVSLPFRQVFPNIDVAWAGFDAMLLVALAGAAYIALRLAVAQLSRPPARRPQVRPCCCDASSTRAEAEQAHMTITRLPVAGHNHGSSILLKGE